MNMEREGEGKMETQKQGEGQVKHVSDGTFEADVLKSEQPVLVDFWAPWCGPCKTIGPVLEELAGKLKGKLAVAKINVDENLTVAAQFGVRSIPSLMVFKGGQMVDSVVGAKPLEELERFVGRWL